MKFKDKYPNCTNLPESYLVKYLGNGKCDWGLSIHGCQHTSQESICGNLRPNSKECGWDDGDCLKYNEYRVKYADCDGYFSSLGDGRCNKSNNNKKCGWDAGDCMEFNKKYPKCLEDPSSIGDGYCNDRAWGSAYNTKECGWDGGDCKIYNFKKKHADCKVDDYTKIGDGKCDQDINGYNSKQCGWDNGDCLSPGAKFGIIFGSLIGFFIVLYLGFYMYCSREQTTGSPIHEYFRNRRQRLEERRSRQMQEGIQRYQQRMAEFERQRRSAIFPLPLAPAEEEPRMDRHTLVLISIIHKKVVSSTTKSNNGDDYEVTILPHETILSERSHRFTNYYEIQLHENESNEGEQNKEEDIEVQQSIMQRKHNVMVETLRSIRAINNCNLKSISSENNDDNDLYNPKVCPICCEEYVKGDDIAWSKNEECVHAFHTDCNVPWLMEHNDCPMCRNDYLCMSC